MTDDPRFPYPSRRGDTLRGLAGELRLALPALLERNPGRGADEPLAPGEPVAVPLARAPARLRLRRSGPLEATLRACLRVRLDGEEAPGVLPVYGAGRGPELVFRVHADRLGREGAGPWEGLLFLAGEEDPLDDVPARGYVRGALESLLVEGRPRGDDPPPTIEQVRRRLEARGLPVLRELAEKAVRAGRRLEVPLRISGEDLRGAGVDEEAPRLRVYLTDGVACDTDRSGAIAVVRLLLEARTQGPADRAGRIDLERDGGGSIPPRSLGGERVVVEGPTDGAPGTTTTELLPLPLEGVWRLVRRRTGTVDRFVDDRRLALGLATDARPTEEYAPRLLVFQREAGEPEHWHRLRPDRQPSSAREFERERRRVEVEQARLVLLLSGGPCGVRLAGAWLDGAPVPLAGESGVSPGGNDSTTRSAPATSSRPRSSRAPRTAASGSVETPNPECYGWRPGSP